MEDSDLQAKYGVGIFAPPTEKELANVNIKQNIDQLISNDEYEEALKIISNLENKPKTEVDYLREKIHLNYGLFLEYRGPEDKSMRYRMNSALIQYINVLKVNPNNKKALTEIKQIMGIYESMPNRSPGKEILSQLKSVGLEY